MHDTTSSRLHAPASHAMNVMLTAPVSAAGREIVSPAALAFVAALEQHFGARRRALLQRRQQVQARLDAGWNPDFLVETRAVREGDWRIAPVPAEIADRRVEITGPVERKMVINALNSGAQVFMADFEDSLSPTWSNVVEGQVNLRDAVAGAIEFTDAQSGKVYRLAERTAVLFARPRGWHLDEKHALLGGRPVSASLFDFGLFLFHNAKALLGKGSRPYFYLPKMESWLEAALWNDVFCFAQDQLGIPRGTIKATVLIETILAAFEMDEILHALREHSAGLNCGRWDYIFSFIKKFRARKQCLLPDRGAVGMTQHFLRSYSQLLIRTCHRRGAQAMGGMAAQIPIKHDAAANERALAKVRADKAREAGDGHDGTWVAHPGLVAVARAEFDRVLGTRSNQIDNLRADVNVTAADLLQVPGGPVTEQGLRQNLDVGVQYLAAWLRGSGCVPLYDLMEDAATAEISRTQVWQQVRHGARLDDGRTASGTLVRALLEEELQKLRARLGAESFAAGGYQAAAALFLDLILAAELPEWLTAAAYARL
jgi:malate synthase